MTLGEFGASEAIRWLRGGIAAICAVFLLMMMALTMADVLGRYLISAPVPGAAEVTELLLAAVIFMGLPAASLDRDHIAVDVLTVRLRRPMRRILARAVALLSGAALVVIARQLWAVGKQIGSYGGFTPTLKLPIAPLAYGVAILCILAGLVTILQVFERARHD